MPVFACNKKARVKVKEVGHSLSTALAGYTRNRCHQDTRGKGGASGMHTRVFIYMLVMIAAVSATCLGSSNWLATGTVTKVDGYTIYFLSKDNIVFHVNASGAVMLCDSRITQGALRTGDKIRVYGTLTGSNKVRAARIRMLTSGGYRNAAAAPSAEKEVRIVVEKESPDLAESCAEPAVSTAQPDLQPDATRPADINLTYTWQGKGLITDVDYVGHQVKIRTSDGQFTINTNNAVMIQGTVRVGLGRLNRGDTLWVAGNEVAPNVVDGGMIRVLRTYTDAQNSVPSLPVSVVGVILNVDYPSRTFKMTGRSTWAVVSCDDNTIIQFQDVNKTFHDLKPGTKINMSGHGNLTDGYSAQRVQIIGFAP